MHYCKETLNRGSLSRDYIRPLYSVLALISPGTPRHTDVAVPVAWWAREPCQDSRKFQGQLSAITCVLQQCKTGGGKHHTLLWKLL